MYSSGMFEKTCPCCKLTLAQDSFYKDKKTKDGLYSRCKLCHLSATSKYAKANKEKSAERAKNWRASNPEKAREISVRSQKKAYAADPEKFRQKAREARAKNPEADRVRSAARRQTCDKKELQAYAGAYYKANSEKIKRRSAERCQRLKIELRPINAERAMRRVANKKMATPPWADVDAIRAVYGLAAEATCKTGKQHHVDHIVPLQSRLVCGLHVPANLQVIPREKNQAKGNRWWPDMP